MSFERMMDYELLTAVDELRNRGYVIVIFTPDEVGEADPSHLEDLMTERGWDYVSGFAEVEP